MTKVMLGGVSQSVDDAPKALLEQSLWAFRADAIYRRIGAMILDEDEPFDLFSIYFGGADVVGHRFLRYSYPTLFNDKPNQDTLDAVGELLRNYYVYLDTVIADLLSRVPPGTTTILVSDHGMSPIHRRSRFSDSTLSGGHLRGPAAFFVAAGPAIKKADRARNPEKIRRRDLPKLGSVLDIAPTILALRGLPVGRDMQGKPMEHILDPAFLEKHPIRTIRSHTGRNWFQSRETKMVGDVDPTERLEQLRTLGYLD